MQVIYYQKVVCYVPTTGVRLSSTKLSRNENSTLIILGSMPAFFFTVIGNPPRVCYKTTDCLSTRNSQGSTSRFKYGAFLMCQDDLSSTDV